MKLKDINNLKRINNVNIRLSRTIFEYELILDYIKDGIETINLYINKYELSTLNFVDHTILNIEEFISNIINKEQGQNSSNKLIKQLYELEKLNFIKLIVTKKNKLCVLNIAQTDNISINNITSFILKEETSFFELKIAFKKFLILYHDGNDCNKDVDKVNSKNLNNLISIYNIIEDNIKRLKLGSRQIYKILKDSDIVNISSKKRKKLIKLIMTNKFDFDKLIYKKYNTNDDNCSNTNDDNCSNTNDDNCSNTNDDNCSNHNDDYFSNHADDNCSNDNDDNCSNDDNYLNDDNCSNDDNYLNDDNCSNDNDDYFSNNFSKNNHYSDYFSNNEASLSNHNNNLEKECGTYIDMDIKKDGSEYSNYNLIQYSENENCFISNKNVDTSDHNSSDHNTSDHNSSDNNSTDNNSSNHNSSDNNSTDSCSSSYQSEDFSDNFYQSSNNSSIESCEKEYDNNFLKDNSKNYIIRTGKISLTKKNTDNTNNTKFLINPILLKKRRSFTIKPSINENSHVNLVKVNSNVKKIKLAKTILLK